MAGSNHISALLKVLKSSKFDNFIGYLNCVGPALDPVVCDIVDSEKTYFESENHADVEKYLFGPISNYTKNCGKLHRPLTCIASYLATCKDATGVQDMITVACAIEHFQTAALVHDDIADGGEIRRGAPCLHKTQGTGLAINVGDFGLSMTIGSVLHHLDKTGYSPEKILEIINQLSFMEYMTIQGQAMDLGWARDMRFDITEQDYICMATKKSAYYSASVPCVLGGICSDVDDSVLLALETYGEKVGLAFQIKDDLINLVEPKDGVKNKDFRSDITEGKRTLCSVKALELSTDNDAKTLSDILKSGTKDADKLEMAVQIMEKCGALEYAKNLADQLCTEAQLVLKPYLPDSK